jgi:hypothetical protein
MVGRQGIGNVKRELYQSGGCGNYEDRGRRVFRV